VKSPPFDMGITIGASIGCVLKGAQNTAFKAHLEKVGFANAMKSAAKFEGSTSKSNGSLMRASPLGVYGYQLADSDLAFISKEDCLLSHPNQSVGDAVACYSIAIAELVKNGNRRKAFERAKLWVSQNGSQEVVSWMDEAERNIRTEYYPNTGFIKIGFVHAFRHLLLGTSYENAIRETLEGGGDTDTNACIVGGLVGAAVGIDGIPKNMVMKVLTCDTSKGGKHRPSFLLPNQIPDLLKAILKVAPSNLQLKNTEFK